MDYEAGREQVSLRPISTSARLEFALETAGEFAGQEGGRRGSGSPAGRGRPGQGPLAIGQLQDPRPIDGTILKKNAEEGNLVNPIAMNGSFSLCDLADLSDLEVELTIEERDISKVAVGQKCKVRTEAYPDRIYEGVRVALDAHRRPQQGGDPRAGQGGRAAGGRGDLPQAGHDRHGLVLERIFAAGKCEGECRKNGSREDWSGRSRRYKTAGGCLPKRKPAQTARLMMQSDTNPYVSPAAEPGSLQAAGLVKQTVRRSFAFNTSISSSAAAASASTSSRTSRWKCPRASTWG